MTDEKETTDEATEESLADQFTDDASGGNGDDASGGNGDDASGGNGDDTTDDPTANGGVVDAQEETSAAVGEYLLKGALVMLVVLGVVATLQFYLSAQSAISRLAADQYRPAFIAAFNLVVLLAVGVGIAQVVRRLG